MVREHESDVYICLAVWYVEGVPCLKDIEVDIHISLITVPAGVPAGAIKEAMQTRWERLKAKTQVDHCRAQWCKSISPFSKPNYMMLDLHMASPLCTALHNIVDAGLSAIPNVGQRNQFMRKYKRVSFHASIQPWPRPMRGACSSADGT